MMTIKISTVDELERAWPVLDKLEPSSSSYNTIKDSLPRFINIHRNPCRGYMWTHSRNPRYHNYPLLDISALYNLEKTNPELFI